jgi:hypothetical protein
LIYPLRDKLWAFVVERITVIFSGKNYIKVRISKKKKSSYEASLHGLGIESFGNNS